MNSTTCAGIHNHPNGGTGASWSNQEGGSQGTWFYDQPPFQEEQPFSWGYQEASPYKEDFPPQPEVKSKFELAIEAFMGHSTRPCATPQPEPKSELKLMVDQFSWGTDEGCSNVDLPMSTLSTHPSYRHRRRSFETQRG
ncbi:unnamed protein product [Linum trigynum]|uniref:Uncharacterized protein n=1 Tax=Linum trigynum TaxID=586398 RepID=A0AAV2FP54_9ROSI